MEPLNNPPVCQRLRLLGEPHRPAGVLGLLYANEKTALNFFSFNAADNTTSAS